jgi:hypothetical protein
MKKGNNFSHIIMELHIFDLFEIIFDPNRKEFENIFVSQCFTFLYFIYFILGFAKHLARSVSRDLVDGICWNFFHHLFFWGSFFFLENFIKTTDLTLSTICLLGKSVKPNKRNVAQ